jgi:hypothetical protein
MNRSDTGTALRVHRKRRFIDIAVADNADCFITDAGWQYADGQYRVLKYHWH